MRKGQGAVEYFVNNSWIILVVVLVGVIIWSLGAFQINPATVQKGFTVIRPELSGLSLKGNGDFVGTFGNKAGTNIIIKSIVIENQLDKKNCSILTTLPIEVRNAEFFKIEAEYCNAASHDGGHYTLNVLMEYDVTVGSTTTQHTEQGMIEGQYV